MVAVLATCVAELSELEFPDEIWTGFVPTGFDDPVDVFAEVDALPELAFVFALDVEAVEAEFELLADDAALELVELEELFDEFEVEEDDVEFEFEAFPVELLLLLEPPPTFPRPPGGGAMAPPT